MKRMHVGEYTPRQYATFESIPIADLGEPELDRLGLGAGHTLNKAQQGLGIGNVRKVVFAVGGG